MSFIKIIPNNKKLLKSSTVRKYLKHVEEEIQKQFLLNPELFLGHIPMTATEVKMRMNKQDPFKDMFNQKQGESSCQKQNKDQQ